MSPEFDSLLEVDTVSPENPIAMTADGIRVLWIGDSWEGRAAPDGLEIDDQFWTVHRTKRKGVVVLKPWSPE